MADLNTDVSIVTLEKNIITRMEYLDYLKQLMAHHNHEVPVKSFAEFSRFSPTDDLDRQHPFGRSMDQTELLMLIESQSERVSQIITMRQALGSLRGAALHGNP